MPDEIQFWPWWYCYLGNVLKFESCLQKSICPVSSRDGQYRGTVTRYFFSTVIGNLSTFSKKYRFWYRRYFFSTFTAVLGTFVWKEIKAIQKKVEITEKHFQTLPT